MKQATFPVVGTLDETLPVTTDPLYQSAALSLTIHKIFKELGDQGMSIIQVDSTDMASIESDLRGFGDTFDTWLSTAAVASTAGEPIPNNPALPSLTAALPALLAGGWAALVPVLINLAIDLVVRYIERKLDPNTSLDEGLAALINEEGVGLADIMEKAMIDRNAGDERYALLWNIARQAIRVQVTSATDLDDVLIDEG